MKYIKPEMSIFEIEEEDVITDSMGLNNGGIGDDSDGELDFDGGFTP